MIVGVDVGGTFTDFVLVDPDGGAQVHHKVRSTPDDPGRAVLNGLTDLGVPLDRVQRVIHGTTVATNTILQRRGARIGLITTEGHRDVLQIRRGNKPEDDVFDLLWEEPEPLVARHLRLDVRERLDYRGRVIEPLAVDEVDLAADHLVAHGVEAIAICFLFSYLDGTHEHEAAAAIRARHPEIELSVSSDLLPQWREYERTATTCADAYVKPILSRYLDRLAAALASAGCEHEPLIMKSNGGVMTSRTARERPIETFLSGPAGGVVASKYHGLQVGSPNLISTDMGGTSFDVALVTDGELSTTTTGWVDPSTPVSIAMLDIRTIGAGGGSIGWIDPGGALKVGPRSAGAVPGPACYGQGGTEPTVTDANVVLGRIGRGSLLAGELEIYPDLAAQAIEERLAGPLRLDVVRAAAGIIQICVARMAGEIRAITAERGVDPRNYALLAGGGGGPLHGAAIAAEFGIHHVIVPAFPGLLSAGGLVLSDLRVDRLRSFPVRIERDGADGLAGAAHALVAEVVADLLAEGYEGEPLAALSLDMKYTGQNWEIEVPVALDGLGVDALARRFDERHEQLYGFALPGHTHEVLAIRASATGPTADPLRLVPRRSFPTEAAAAPAPVAAREVWDDRAERYVEGAIHVWDELRPGDRIPGPAVIEGMDSTVWVPGAAIATVDPAGNVLLDL